MLARLSLLLAVLLRISAQCPPAGFDAVKPFELERFVDERWYSLRQLPVSYQPVDQFNCVFAQYNIATKRKSLRCRVFGCSDVPEIAVFNSARQGSATGPAVSIKFKATIPDFANDPAKANIAPTFLPNFIRGSGTNYWVVAVGSYNELSGLEALPDSTFYEWAIITTALPGAEGANGLCYSAGGMWFFSRQAAPPDGVLDAMVKVATGLGLDASVLLPVNQAANCDYGNGKGTFLTNLKVFASGLTFF